MISPAARAGGPRHACELCQRRVAARVVHDAALARLEVLRKCTRSELEVLELPSLQSRLSLRVGILRRFDSDEGARAWLTEIKRCAPRSRLEKVSTYILNR
jgi:hypothetical protein